MHNQWFLFQNVYNLIDTQVFFKLTYLKISFKNQ
jgi:hypothetical protein